MSLIDVGGIELDCERSGSGPPLLMIMGMSGTALSWGEPILEELRREFEVIVYDHRGVGASTRLEGPITTAEMAADAHGLMRALELDSAHVFGISMGGMVAQELALAHPETIRTLTLGCTYCGGPESVRPDVSELGPLIRARQAGDREAAMRASWELNVSPAFAALEPEWEAFAERVNRRPVAISVIAQQARAIEGHNTAARLGMIAAPTLVIHGSLDRLLPVANGRLIASLIPGARLEILEGGGHLFVVERPEQSAALLREHALVHA
jgi:3-oxoadipate enol-lactonase